MSKIKPINAKKVVILGPILLELELQDFMQLVYEKEPTIIRLNRAKKNIVYLAVDAGIAYYTATREEKPEITTDFVSSKIRSSIFYF